MIQRDSCVIHPVYALALDNVLQTAFPVIRYKLVTLIASFIVIEYLLISDGIDATLPAALDREKDLEVEIHKPLNQLITLAYSATSMRVIGVVKNAVIGSPMHAPSPALYFYNPGWTGSILNFARRPFYETTPDTYIIFDI